MSSGLLGCLSSNHTMAATTGRAHAISLVALLFSAATTGFAYLSSVYSEALKNELGLSQDNIDTISMFVGAAGFLGVVPGRIADVLGSRRAIAFGGLLQSLSYSGQYVVARKTFEAVRPLYALCFLNFVSWVGVATTAAASFAALSRLYAGHQGLVVGVGKCWVGLIGALATQGYRGFAPSTSDATDIDFILVLAAVALAHTWLAALALRPAALAETFDGSPRPGRRRAILGIIFLSIVATTVQAVADLEGTVRVATAAAVLALYAAPVGTALLPPDDAAAAAAREPLLVDAKPALRGLSTLEMLREPSCWLLLWTFGAVVGGGVIVTVNGAQQAIAAGAPNGADTVVTLFAVAQSITRVGAGLGSDALRSRGAPVQRVFLFSAVAMGCAHAIMWLSTPAALFLGSACAGAACFPASFLAAPRSRETAVFRHTAARSRRS